MQFLSNLHKEETQVVACWCRSETLDSLRLLLPQPVLLPQGSWGLDAQGSWDGDSKGHGAVSYCSWSQSRCCGRQRDGGNRTSPLTPPGSWEITQAEAGSEVGGGQQVSGKWRRGLSKNRWWLVSGGKDSRKPNLPGDGEVLSRLSSLIPTFPSVLLQGLTSVLSPPGKVESLPPPHLLYNPILPPWLDPLLGKVHKALSRRQLNCLSIRPQLNYGTSTPWNLMWKQRKRKLLMYKYGKTSMWKKEGAEKILCKKGGVRISVFAGENAEKVWKETNKVITWGKRTASGMRTFTVSLCCFDFWTRQSYTLLKYV